MQTGSHHVTIEVSPSRLELAFHHGRGVTASKVLRLVSRPDDELFPESLDLLAVPLRQLVAELGCAGRRAVVVYQSGTSPVLVNSLPVNLSAAETEGAARLGLAGVADFSLEHAAVELCPLFVDSPSGGAERPSRMAHVLGAAEAATTMETIAAWVEGAGLVFQGAIPAAAVALHGAAHSAWKVGRRAGESAAVLWIGEHGSAIACMTEGSLRFARLVGVGLEALIDAMCQPLRANDESESPITLDRAAARGLLATVGIPSADVELPGLPGFRGSALLPVLQPALQRMSIETKQSLRFGLPESERAGVRLLIVGPGAAVPGLAHWLSRQCSLQLIEPATPCGGSLESSAETGILASVSAAGSTLPILVPERLALRARRTRARIAVAVGALIAGGWVAAEGYSARTELQREGARLALLERAAREHESVTRIQAATLAARMMLESTEARIAQSLGVGADADGVLQAISLGAPETVRIGTIELSTEKSGIVCRVSGHVRMSESDDPTADIARFVEAINAVPIVRRARLGSTQRTRIDGAQSHAFDLSVELVPIPLHARSVRTGSSIAATKELP